MPPIEEQRDRGEQVRRIFYVDGYGRDLILISFIRAPGRDPAVRVHYPAREGEPRPEPIQAPVPQAVWNEVAEAARDFDRTYAAVPGADPAAVSICSHSWLYTIEAAERRRGPAPAPIRRKTEDACEHGPGQVFATEVQRQALALFPACAALDPEQHRNPAAMLDACRILGGDRLAAAEVLNLAGGFRRIRGPDDAHRLAGRFAQETEIDWNGERYRGAGYRAPAFWAAHVAQQSGWANFYFERVEAESADRVRLTGRLHRSVDGPQGRGNSSQEASVEQIWARDFNGEMTVASATIGPWLPDPPR